MSQAGISKFSGMLSDMQRIRIELLEGADQQDILLGQLCEKMKEHVKDDFCKITIMQDPKPIKRRNPNG